MNVPVENTKTYLEFVSTVKDRVLKSKFNAFKAVNKELISLYLDIGELITKKQEEHSWGKSIVESLASAIQRDFPHLKGFSARNIWRMKQFYEAYSNRPSLSAMLTEITWTNHLHILSKTKTMEEKEFYLIEGGCNGYNQWKYIEPEKVKEYIKIPYDLIIASNDLRLIKQSLQYDVSIPPVKIRVFYSGPENLEERKNIIKKYNCLFTQLLQPYEVGELITEGIKQSRAVFYVPLQDGEILDRSFIDRCEQLYNDELRLFDVVEGKNTLVKRPLSFSTLQEFKQEYPEKYIQL